MMIPEAWENHRTMDPARRAFYRYHASLMEPWDGPAAVAFTDGTVIGAVLDRNGLRPARYWVTDDGPGGPGQRGRRARRPPGPGGPQGPAAARAGCSWSTPRPGRIVDDDEIKAALAAEHPYAEWLEHGQIDLDDLPPRTMLTPQHASVVGRQRLFGYTDEELRLIVAPMARTGAEPIGSMGSDTAIAVLSERPRLLYDYFTQLFAQVTNPPLDAIREELVTSLQSTLGPEANLLEPTAELVPPDHPAHAGHRQRRPGQAALRQRGRRARPGFRAFAIDGLFEVAGRRRRPCATAIERRPGPGRARPSTTGPTSSSSPTATRRPSWRPSRRCCWWPPSTTTWSAPRPAPGSAWWSSPATPARSTTWPC